MGFIFAKRLHVRMKSWLGHNYSETSGNRYELELYLDFGGIQFFSFKRQSTNQFLQPEGFVENSWAEPMIYPIVFKNKFKVRLRAVERDSPDPDDHASGTIEIDLDKEPPHSSWSVIAHPPRGKDLKMQVWFDIVWIDYLVTNDGHPPSGIQNTDNHPYPRDGLRLFEHGFGLGRSVPVPIREQNKLREFGYSYTGEDGRKKSSTYKLYRYVVTELGMAHDVVSSIYVPPKATVILHEHAPNDSRFDESKGKSLRSKGLYNMSDLKFDNMLSTIDVGITYNRPDVR